MLQGLKAVLHLATTNMESADGTQQQWCKWTGLWQPFWFHGLGVMSKGYRNPSLPQGGDVEVPSVIRPDGGLEWEHWGYHLWGRLDWGQAAGTGDLETGPLTSLPSSQTWPTVSRSKGLLPDTHRSRYCGPGFWEEDTLYHKVHQQGDKRQGQIHLPDMGLVKLYELVKDRLVWGSTGRSDFDWEDFKWDHLW